MFIKMKKAFVILLATVMTLTLVLSSCSASENRSGENSDNEYKAADAYPGIGADGGNANGNSVIPFDSSERYLEIEENVFNDTQTSSAITFSLKVDTSSYTNIERYLNASQLPPRDAVKTEEMINYFNYDKKLSSGYEPFSIYSEIGPSIFDSSKLMAFVRIKTEDVDRSELKPSNLTFLIDTSGSMSSYDKLPLLQSSLSLFTDTLGENDTVSIVTYAGSSSVLLDGVSGYDKKKIKAAVNSLTSSGSTAGADGINTAYALAAKNFKQDGNNRIILASDGDFNVGISSLEELQDLIASKRDSGIYLSILGFGTGNLRDDIMETLATHGSGNYSYINSLHTAQKVLIDDITSNMFVIAEDVKAQIEFNPDAVKTYRRIGYENRTMNNEDFENDAKDAGEIGIGTDIVCMFELDLQDVSYFENTDTLFEVRIRYKDPGDSESKLITCYVGSESVLTENSSDFNFASSVAAFGDLLRGSVYSSEITADMLIEKAGANLGENGEKRMIFLELLDTYKLIYASDEAMKNDE